LRAGASSHLSPPSPERHRALGSVPAQIRSFRAGLGERAVIRRPCSPAGSQDPPASSLRRIPSCVVPHQARWGTHGSHARTLGMRSSRPWAGVTTPSFGSTCKTECSVATRIFTKDIRFAPDIWVTMDGLRRMSSCPFLSLMGHLLLAPSVGHRLKLGTILRHSTVPADGVAPVGVSAVSVQVYTVASGWRSGAPVSCPCLGRVPGGAWPPPL